ncbi:hypothetical protein CBER1_07192 [Cercospora berteroae]|uniref:F-box domain-containing protein n=1 Tax=Cercospora berteroae TaxID=357750 RepID=A0A2S6BRU9_9PEZI|nr:hypothetical protein CBER1_07192 [Cercospora berteroae]
MSSTPTPSFVAATKALDTPELLERILLHLPTKSLYGVTRVSKLWKSSMAASPALNSRLHRPLYDEEFWIISDKDRTLTRLPGYQQFMFGTNTMAPTVLNEILFEPKPTGNIFVGFPQITWVKLNINLTKVTAESTCLQLPLTWGPARQIGLDMRARKEGESREEIVRCWVEDTTVLKDIWEHTTLNGLNKHSIEVMVGGFPLVSESLLEAVKRTGVWHYPIIAREEGKDILEKIVEFLPLEDKRSMKQVCKCFREKIVLEGDEGGSETLSEARGQTEGEGEGVELAE